MQTNPLFDKYKDDYTDLQDFFDGERQVKKKGDRYTPCLEGHKKTIDEGLYERYVEFGILYNALHRTRQGLKGAILRKPTDIIFPESKKELLDTIMLDGASFNDFIRETCDSILGFGRFGALVDIGVDEVPYVATYNALSILNWPTIRSKDVKQEIQLMETIEIPDLEDTSKTKQISQLRKLEIDVTGFYLVTLYRKEEKEAGQSSDEWSPVESTVNAPNPRMPKYKGKRLNFIPFVFFGSSSNVPSPSRPPLLDLLNILKGHWKLTVSYQYGLYFAGLPTPWFAGFEHEEGAKAPLGPGAAYFAADPNATCGFLQTGGEGLSAMEHGLDRLEKQMAIVGSRMLMEEQRAGIEAAETVRLRSSGDSATLSDVAGNIEAGLTDVLQFIGFWEGIVPTECSASVNKDFVSSRLGAQEITALVQTVQAGQISTDTFIYNLMQGEIIRPGKTIEEEMEDIAEDKLTAARNNPNLTFVGANILAET